MSSTVVWCKFNSISQHNACSNPSQVEVITSDFDFIRSSGNPGSSPGTTYFLPARRHPRFGRLPLVCRIFGTCRHARNVKLNMARRCRLYIAFAGSVRTGSCRDQMSVEPGVMLEIMYAIASLLRLDYPRSAFLQVI